MRLTDFKGEEAIDVLAEIMLPFSVIINDEEFQKRFKAKGVSRMETASYVLKEHKKEILDIYEPLTREKREEATPTKLIQLILDIINDPELRSLFISQGQQEALKTSGSVTENTKENGF